MKKTVFLLIVLCMSFVIFSGNVEAAKAIVTITVMNWDSPVSDADVKMGGVIMGKTDSLGTILLVDVKRKKYSLEIIKDGFLTSITKVKVNKKKVTLTVPVFSNETGTLRINLEKIHYEPLPPGILVKLYETNTKVETTGETDENSSVRIELPEGSYMFKIWVSGFKKARFLDEEIHAGEEKEARIILY